MSLEDAQAFLRRMEEDEELARETARERRRQLAALAREQGYDVSEDDLAAAAREAQSQPYAALDDADLDAVVGGAARLPDYNMSFN
jgi:predicted ribosomally synthesized peptide with nif11-like leader